MANHISSSSPSPLPPLLFLSPPSPNPTLDTRISPSILLIIIILAIIFFVSGLLHLLVRCLLRPTARIRDPDPDPTALQGQLRQLFHLHDGGVDQSFIDTLPVFAYKAILGVKDPFDCAVCLCEFEFEDKLRLLPKCSHAFHVHCIDTWLLSHSTCPLCRFSLLNGFNGSGVPFVCVLESSRDMGESLPIPDSGELGLGVGMGPAEVEVRGKGQGERIVTVKLGKFRNVDEGEGSSVDINDNNGNLGSRRCYSMGSFAYVLDETTSLHVPIRSTPAKKPSKKKPKLPGYSTAMSEYDSDSRREFQVHFHGNGNGNASGRSKRDSFSISKIWTRGERGIRKGNEMDGSELGGQLCQIFGDGETQSCCSVDSLAKKPSMKKPPGGSTTMLEYSSDIMRGFQQNTSGRSKRDSFSISKIWKGNESSISEIEIEGSEELSQRFGDEETQSCYSVDSLANPTSSSTCTSNKRTLLWLMGRHNKVVHNHSLSFSSNN